MYWQTQYNEASELTSRKDETSKYDDMTLEQLKAIQAERAKKAELKNRRQAKHEADPSTNLIVEISNMCYLTYPCMHDVRFDGDPDTYCMGGVEIWRHIQAQPGSWDQVRSMNIYPDPNKQPTNWKSHFECYARGAYAESS